MAFDHVIIGGGINGLVAAALLSGQGAKVLLVERGDHLGGCMLSAEATLPGFVHDVMAATFVLFLTGPAHGELGKDLARHGLEFCHTPHPTAVLRSDGSAAVLTTDRVPRSRPSTAGAGDGDRHAADVGSIEASAPLLFGLLGGQLWSAATAKLLAREAWRRGLRGLAAYLGEALQPARGWLESGYASPQLQALYAPWVLHCGLSPEDAYSAQMGKVVAFALEAAGAPVVKGGAGRAADAFRALIEERGGEVRTGAEVERILVRGGRAAGVLLAGGQEIAARKSVIASVAPGQLYGRLLGEDAPAAEKAALRDFRHGRGDFQLHYALDRPPRWKTPGLERVALIHFSDGIDAVSKSHNEATRGLLPETPTFCLGQPAALDPSRCRRQGVQGIKFPRPANQGGTAADHAGAADAPCASLRHRVEPVLAATSKASARRCSPGVPIRRTTSRPSTSTWPAATPMAGPAPSTSSSCGGRSPARSTTARRSAASSTSGRPPIPDPACPAAPAISRRSRSDDMGAEAGVEADSR